MHAHKRTNPERQSLIWDGIQEAVGIRRVYANVYKMKRASVLRQSPSRCNVSKFSSIQMHVFTIKSVRNKV